MTNVRARRVSPVFRGVFWVLLPAAGLWSQTPPQPGKLTITSTPKGAAIVIDGKKMPQPTDATFVVSPGTYRVSVADATGNLKNCPTRNVAVSSGSQTVLDCSATGWTSSAK